MNVFIFFLFLFDHFTVMSWKKSIDPMAWRLRDGCLTPPTVRDALSVRTAAARVRSLLEMRCDEGKLRAI